MKLTSTPTIKLVAQVFYTLIFAAIFATNLSGQTHITDSMFFDGEMRDWIIFEPTGYDASTATPLVLNLHGAGSNATEQSVYSQFNTVADTVGALVIYPNAIDNFWNSGFASLPPDYVDDVYFLTSLIDSMKQWYNVDAERVYTMGMSNGGFMSYRLVCETNEVFAAMASVTGSMAGGVFSGCDAAGDGSAVPVLQMHGTADGTVSFTGSPDVTSQADIIAYWAARNNCPAADVYDLPDIEMSDGSTVEVSRYYFCDDYSEVIFYRIENGGHTWPGSFPVPSLGATNQDMQAEFEIWKFFTRHKLSDQFTAIDGPSDNGNAAEGITVSPNPFSSQFQFTLPASLESKDFIVKLVDVNGRVVLSQIERAASLGTSASRSQVTLDGHSLASGIYFLQVFPLQWAQNRTYFSTHIIRR